MKSLDSLLHSLRLRSTVQNRVVVGEPWGISFPACQKSGQFHFIESGGGILTVAGEASVQMEPGDLAIVFGGRAHTVQDVLRTYPIPICQLLDTAYPICPSGLTLRFGGDGGETSVITGDFCLEEAQTHPLWRLLPSYILLKGQNGQAVEWLDTTLGLLSRESMEVRPGVRAVLDRLCDVLFIQALRGWVRTEGTVEGLPAAVRDTEIDEALDLMQRFPSEAWTVEKLATQVALSRSTFAERFRRLTGETPMEYLAHWRMHVAAQTLRNTKESVAYIAQQVGYESEAAFAKAFKRIVGVAPGAYRRNREIPLAQGVAQG